MSFLRRLTIRQKLAALIGVTLAVFALSAVVQARTLQRYAVGGPAYAELERQADTSDTMRALLGELNAARATLHLMLAPMSEDREKLLRRHWEESAAGVDARFERALAQADAPDTKLYLSDAREAWQAYAKAVREHVFGVPVAERTRALATFLEGPFTRRHARFTELIEASSNGVRLRSAKLERQVGRTVDLTRWAILAAAVGLGLFLLAFLSLVARSITRPLAALVRRARQVESGDLTVDLHSGQQDELGQLSRSLDGMVRHLRGLLGAAQQVGQEIASAVDHMASAASEQSRVIERQAAAVNQTSATAHEIRQTSDMAARQAAEALRAAERAGEVGRTGLDALAGSLQGIQDIRTQIDEIARRVVDLAERSVKVATITDTVRDLAEQSHVLALNAAIEAARAGESGLGFTVVAAEMRSLADLSVKATVEVRKEMHITGGSVRNTVNITEQGRARVQAGLDQVRLGGERLQELTRMLTESSQGLQQISAAVQQQHAGVSQIFGAVSELSRTTEEAVSSVDATRLFSEHLKGITAKLTEALAGFRLHEGDAVPAARPLPASEPAGTVRKAG